MSKALKWTDTWGRPGSVAEARGRGHQDSVFAEVLGPVRGRELGEKAERGMGATGKPQLVCPG